MTILVAALFLFQSVPTITGAIAGNAPIPLPTPILSPNVGQVGNSANSVQPPVLTFGKQGISGGVGTPSMAIPISVNNCSTVNIAACTGTGTLTLGPSYASITGTNAADFTFAAGPTNPCSNNLGIASGSYCEVAITFTPSQPAGTNETATLTISYAGGVTASTMSLTGTSATVITLSNSSSPTALAAGTNYQATGDISCATSCFTVGAGSSSFTDLNLNGHTLTWCTGTSAAQEGGVITRGNNWNLSVHNGKIVQGGGSCTGTISGGWGSGAVIGTGSNGMAGTSLYNLTLSWSALNGRGEADNYAGSITGFATVIHDVVFTDNDPGGCSTVGCRSQDQFYSFTVVQAAQRTVAPFDQFYNNTAVSGGPQGTFASNSTGATCSNNLINLGNSGAGGTVANGYACQVWGDKWTVQNNLYLGTGTNGGWISGRGIQLANVSGQQVTHTTVQNNNGIINILDNDLEYACSSVEYGATYSVQIKVFGSGVMANNVIQNNNLVAQAKNCGAYGFSTTNDSSAPTTGSVGNVLQNNKWTCVSVAPFTWTSNTNCAGMRVDYAVGNSTPMFSSNSDTVTGDTSDIYVYFDGSDPVNFNQDTFVKPATAVGGWVWIDFTHGLCCASTSFKGGPFNFVDPVFKGGATESNTNLATWASNNTTSAFTYFIQYTQTVIVNNSSNLPVYGATVTYTDALNNTYTGTTNSSGVATIIVNKTKYAAASGTLTTTNYNNYSRLVTATGCGSNNATGINITSPNTVTVTLSGTNCSLTSAFFGFDQTGFGGTRENTGLTYGWQRSWDTTCVWANIEATAGTYAFDTQCHTFIQSAVNHHAGITFVMGRTPASRITGTCSGSYGVGCAQLASDIDGANTITGAFVTALSNYMNTTWPAVKWRIEGRNESDLSGECAENSSIGGHCSMVHLVKEQQDIYNTAKGISTNIQVLCPATSTYNQFSVHLYGGTDSGSAPFTGSGFAAAGGLAYCDTMNVHPYFYQSVSTCSSTGGVGSGSSPCFALNPEAAVNGSFTCSATSTTMNGGLGQIACVLATAGKTGMAVESSETDWGSTPSNAQLTDTQKRQWIGRYTIYAWNSGQTNVSWYQWDCSSGNLYACFGTLSGSGVSSAGATALATLQDWLIGSTNTASPCTIISGTTYECALNVNTASGKSGSAHIVFDNSGAAPTIVAFGANTAYRLDGTALPVTGNLYTVDGEPTLLMTVTGGPQPITAPAVLFASTK